MRGDPTAVLVRTTGMMTQTSTLVHAGKPFSQNALSAAHILKHRLPKPAPVKEVNVTAPQKPDRMAWVSHMHAIRDNKDRAAFAEIFGHFAPRVKGFLMKSGANADLAEDITQDVMATLWRKAHMFDPAKASVSTWIFTIARNRKIDVLRKQRRPEPEDLPWGPAADPAQDDVLVHQQDCEHLGEALAALPEKQKDLIVRAYYGDLTHAEIAEQTGLPLGTIKSRIRLALERLRHQMK